LPCLFSYFLIPPSHTPGISRYDPPPPMSDQRVASRHPEHPRWALSLFRSRLRPLEGSEDCFLIFFFFATLDVKIANFFSPAQIMSCRDFACSFERPHSSHRFTSAAWSYPLPVRKARSLVRPLLRLSCSFIATLCYFVRRTLLEQGQPPSLPAPKYRPRRELPRSETFPPFTTDRFFSISVSKLLAPSVFITSATERDPLFFYGLFPT